MNYLEEIKKIEPLKEPIEKMEIFDDEQIETLYAAGFGLYEVGDYAGACLLFTRLILQDPLQPRFWQALASTKQMNCEYEASLRAWSMLGYLEPENGDVHFHAAECLISLGQKEDALKALNLAENRLNKEHIHYNRVQALKERLCQ